jgi:tetrapyrrole methylase family protein / MazG family protein
MSSSIVVVGLGPGDKKHLTIEAYETITSTGRLFVRTRNHPTLEGLTLDADVESFDWAYEQAGTFEEAYDLIASRLIEIALEDRQGDVVFAVPGDPSIGETTVALLRQKSAEKGIALRIIAGISYVEPALAALDIDPMKDGLQLVDAMAFEMPINEHFTSVERLMRLRPPLEPTTPALISQVYNQNVASALKLGLLEYYPDDHEITLVRSAGLAGQEIRSLPLYQLDWPDTQLDHLTLLYVPPIGIEECLKCFRALEWVIAKLRAPDGCPWDREQTHHSIKPNLIEETYEVVEALDLEDSAKLEEELGDLLMQVVLHAEISTEAGEFNMGDIIAGITKKLMRRHPHVFGSVMVSSSGEVLRNWEEIKKQERAQAGLEAGEEEQPPKSLLSGVPLSMPALSYAQAIQDRAARVGFDWPDIQGVIDKVKEEIAELSEAADKKHELDELGDILFSIVNVSRWLGIDAEDALRSTNTKFKERFYALELAAAKQGRSLSDMMPEELDQLWEAAKASGAGPAVDSHS